MTAARASIPRLITRWATQAGREPAALSREQALLDARGFADLLAESAHLAGLVGFQEGERLIGGDWRSVLAADPTMVLALLATIDIEGRSEGLEALLDEARATATIEEAEQLLTRLLEGLLRFGAELDEWLAPAAVGGLTEGHEAHRLIEASIDEVLGPALRALLAEVAAAEGAGLLHAVLPHRHHDRLRDRWRLALIEAEVEAVRDVVERVWIDRLLDRIAEVAEAFVHELREIGTASAAALESSLGSGRHSPHVALVMTFARIFRHAQDRLNDVPQRIARFYHEEVLREVPRGAASDTVFLTITPRRNARPRIEPGTLFSAGKDAAGAPIGFAADSPLDVTGARLAEVRLWTQMREQDEGVERVEARLFAAGPDGVVSEEPAGIAAPVPGIAVVPAAVIAAPALPQGGSARRIALSLVCDGLPEAATATMLAGSLGLSVSTGEGWLDLADARITPFWEVEAGTIRVVFELVPEFPRLAPCPPGTPDAPPGAALRVALRQDRVAGAADPWALLAAVMLRDAKLEVAVRDVGDLVVSTPTGPASAAGAAPFGAPPFAGGWLRVDHPVLAGPPLDRLLLRFDWAALPLGPDGITGHYREYLVDAQGELRDFALFTNDAFLVMLAAPVRGWDATQPLPLFASAEPDVMPPVPAYPAPDIFAADADFGAAAPAPSLYGALASASWFAAAASGETEALLPDHVTVTLAAPADGFGDGLYSVNVAHATRLLAEADAPPPRHGLIRRVIKWILNLPGLVLQKLGWLDEPEDWEPGERAGPVIPNPPFRPMLAGISMDYALSVSGDALALYHARPLEGLHAAASLAGARLFAPLPHRPTIDCALAGARPGETLSLLFLLGPPSGEVGEVPAAPVLRYHAADGWRALPPGALLSDRTTGLSQTGLLRIAMPADAAPIADDDALWLRIVFARNDPIPAIMAVAPDALSATRLLAGGAASFAPIAPGTITKLPGLPGIAHVGQPLASAGGRPAEDSAMLRRRVAERVRHRGRGVTGWDMERLVLSEYPGIDRVRVLAAEDPASGVPGGDVTVVVVPARDGADPPDPDRPRASPALRGIIGRRLEAMASPFACLHVVDPIYVPVDVTAQILVEADCAERLQAALASLLSPWADPGLDLDDEADVEALRAAIAAFLLVQPGVLAIERLKIRLGDAAEEGWRVPVAGTLEVAAIAAERSAMSW